MLKIVVTDVSPVPVVRGITDQTPVELEFRGVSDQSTIVGVVREMKSVDLQLLSIWSCRLMDEGMAQLLEEDVVRRCPRTYFVASRVSPVGFREIGRYGDLQWVDVSFHASELDDDSVVELCRVLPGGLRSLDIGSSNVTDRSVETVRKFFSATLDSFGVSHTDVSVAAIQKMLSLDFPRLSGVSFDNVQG